MSPRLVRRQHAPQPSRTKVTRTFNNRLTRELLSAISEVEKLWWIIHRDRLDGIVDTATETITWQQTDDQPDAERMVRRLFAHGNTAFVTTESFEEHRRRRMRDHFEREQQMAAVREHQAHRTRYEKQLNMPALSASTHARGAVWRPEQMCSAQWRQLLQIRAHDRERRARKREHDRVVERELQTVTAPSPVPVAA